MLPAVLGGQVAVDAVRCTTLAPGEVEDLQVELLKAQAGCDVHHVFIYLKHQASGAGKEMQ